LTACNLRKRASQSAARFAALANPTRNVTGQEGGLRCQPPVNGVARPFGGGGGGGGRQVTLKKKGGCTPPRRALARLRSQSERKKERERIELKPEAQG
jgi:hypothetical protein